MIWLWPGRGRFRSASTRESGVRFFAVEAWRKSTLDDIDWQPVEGFPNVWMRFLGENLDEGPWVLHVKHGPNYVENRHWHEADTVYVFTAGEMIVDGEGSYRPGDVRWVRAHHFYGPERAGPGGCEFLLVGAGNPMMHYEPPNEAERLSV